MTSLLLIAIGLLVLAQSILVAKMLVSLRNEILAVHVAVNSNLSDAQTKLNTALVKIESLEQAIAKEGS